ncbi:MAG: MFS transporter, partial [Dehalococcoidia bacterium]
TMAMASALLLFPFYWQGVRGFSAQTAGVLLLPLAGTFMLAAPVAGLLSDRWGARIIGSVGLGIVAVGMFLLSGVGVDTPIWSVLLRLVVLGMGMGMFMAPNNNAVMSAVPPQRRGIASGLLGTTRYLGQTIGITFAGTLFAVFATSGGFRLGQEGLPGPDTINRLASDPEAYAAVQMAFVNGMSGVFLVCIPLALIGVTLSWMRGKPVADDGRVTSEEAATEPAQRGP